MGILKADAIKELDKTESRGPIFIKGAFHSPVKAELYTLPVQLITDPPASDLLNRCVPLPVTFAVTDELNVECDALLPTDVVEELKAHTSAEAIYVHSALN